MNNPTTIVRNFLISLVEILNPVLISCNDVDSDTNGSKRCKHDFKDFYSNETLGVLRFNDGVIDVVW